MIMAWAGEVHGHGEEWLGYGWIWRQRGHSSPGHCDLSGGWGRLAFMLPTLCPPLSYVLHIVSSHVTFWHLAEISRISPILPKKSKPEEMNNWPTPLMKGRSGHPIATDLPILTRIEGGLVVSGSREGH